MERLVYGIFAGTKWGIRYNRRDAIKLAKANDAQIRTMSLGLYNSTEGSMFGSGWDMPTFYAQSDPMEMKREQSLRGT